MLNIVQHVLPYFELDLLKTYVYMWTRFFYSLYNFEKEYEEEISEPANVEKNKISPESIKIN